MDRFKDKLRIPLGYVHDRCSCRLEDADYPCDCMMNWEGRNLKGSSLAPGFDCHKWDR